MSDKNLNRIKQIRQKSSSGNYLAGIPIGTDGLLVDMLSNLDLEEELRLGGNHYVEIQDDDQATRIYEWYYTEPKQERTVEQMSQFTTYSTYVLVNNQAIYNIIDSEGKKFITIKQQESSDYDFIVAIEEAIEDYLVIVNLYKGDVKNGGKLLHQKLITVEQKSPELSTIREDLDI